MSKLNIGNCAKWEAIIEDGPEIEFITWQDDLDEFWVNVKVGPFRREEYADYCWREIAGLIARAERDRLGLTTH